MTNAWQNLDKYVQHLQGLSSSIGLASWDQETKMPTAGGAARANMIEALSRVHHEASCSKKYSELLETAKLSTLTTEQSFVVNKLISKQKKDQSIPADLNAEISKHSSLSQQAWSEARQKKDPSSFLPFLEKMVSLKQQTADCLGENRYDALLDEYEPDFPSDTIDGLLKGLETELPPLLASLQEKSKSSFQFPVFPIPQQEIFGIQVLQKIGFDFNNGRLDLSEHPFTDGLHPTDVRITTRYDDTNFQDALFSTLHEGGHGLYEQGLNPAWSGYPTGQVHSLGLHESQSRLWENLVGRSESFWNWAYPQLQKLYPLKLSQNEFLQQINKVQGSFIRVDADEVSYNLHICLRYKLEKALIEGEISVSDLEGEWNILSQQLLGITPTHAFEGFCQDVHWSVGLFGYFPTYSLGNLISAQLFSKMTSENTALQQEFSLGNFNSALQWLRSNVHQHGARYSAPELVKKITGEDISAQPFLDYLNKKYNTLFP